MHTIHLRTPGKINWSIRVLGKRADGYHELDMLLNSVDLYDEVTLTLSDRPGVRLSCPGAPEGPDNLAWRAAGLLLPEGLGVDIAIAKGIPLAGGMAGGSADAAAVLLGLNRLLGGPRSPRELAELGLSLGADVPFCLAGGCQRAQGVGERLTPVDLPAYHLVLLGSGATLSTARVFGALTPPYAPGDIGAVAAALAAGDAGGAAAVWFNALEAASLPLCPAVGRAMDDLLAAGAVGARMSGSGPTVFGLFADEADAQRAAAQLTGRYPLCRAARTLNTGILCTRG